MNFKKSPSFPSKKWGNINNLSKDLVMYILFHQIPYYFSFEQTIEGYWHDQTLKP